MEKSFNKIKAALATLGIIVISFSSKIFGQEWTAPNAPNPEPMYGVQRPMQALPSPDLIAPVLKIGQYLLLGVIFIVGIVNFIKIKKTNDKSLEKKKIRNTIIIIFILVLLLIATFVILARLLTR